MVDFMFHTPTKIYFGKDKHKEIGKIITEFGFKKIMLQYGKNSIKRNGLYDDIMTSLTEYGIEVVECSGVSPNPKVGFVRDAVKIAKEEKVDLILAVGGGSVIDSAKSTALCAKSEHDPWDIQTGKVPVESTLPVASILTHAASGSEMSRSCVLTNEETQIKAGCPYEIRCCFSILNPELTYSVSPYQTACGVVDMLTHTLERYFTVSDPVELTDRIAESVMKTIINQGRIVIQNPNDYNARANLMWASSLSHNGLTGCGRSGGFTVHPIEHAVSGLYDSVAHGAGLAVLYPAWAKVVYQYDIPRFAQFARNVWDVVEPDDQAAAVRGIEEMARFFRDLGMPDKLSAFGIEAEAIESLANHCTNNGTTVIENYISLGKEEIKQIFALCF